MTSIAHNTMTLGYDLEDGPPAFGGRIHIRAGTV